MAFSKAKDFPVQLYQQAQWAKAQAHPARIIILEYLHFHGATPFKTLRSNINLAPTTVSQHVRFLHKEGFIAGKNDYPSTTYWILPEVCAMYAAQLKALQEQFCQSRSN